jgi:hypothetical protein
MDDEKSMPRPFPTWQLHLHAKLDRHCEILASEIGNVTARREIGSRRGFGVSGWQAEEHGR